VASSVDDSKSSAARVWLAILALAGVAEAVYAVSMPLPELAALIPDDSYFYLQVAERYATHGTFTFGPGAETYGFQPLWQLLVIGLAYFTPDRSALLHATLLACVALRVLTGMALFRLGRSLWGVAAGVFASAVWAFDPAIAVWSWGLKENTLYALLLVLAAQALLAWLRHGADWKRGARLGLCLGLCVFTRVNAVVPALAFTAVALLAPGAWPRVRRWPGLLVAAAVALLVALPWYLFAYARFGAMLPTSGSWKLAIGRAHVEQVWQVGWGSLAHLWRGLEETLPYLRRTLAAGFGPLEFLLAGGAAVVLPAMLVRAARRPLDCGSLSVPAGLGVAAGLGAWLTSMTLGPYLAYAKWYTVPEYVGLALLFGLVLGQAWALRRWLLGRAALVTVLSAALLVWPADGWRGQGWLGSTLPRHVLSRAPSATQTLELGLWAARHVPATVTLGMFDPGAITYFSGCNVVSLDPLMNSLAYQSEGLRDPAGRILKTCAEQGIGHVVGSGFRAEGKWVFRGLPAGTYDVLWVPFPDAPLPWGGRPPVHAMVVRLRGSPAPEFVRPDVLPHGLYRPNDPDQTRAVEATARPLLASADALRLRVANEVAGTWSVWVDGHEVAQAPVDGGGWAFFDLRAVPKARRSLRFDGAPDLPPLLAAYEVDFTFPVRR